VEEEHHKLKKMSGKENYPCFFLWSGEKTITTPVIYGNCARGKPSSEIGQKKKRGFGKRVDQKAVWLQSKYKRGASRMKGPFDSNEGGGGHTECPEERQRERGIALS